MKKVINLIAILAGLLIIPMLSYAQTQYVCLYNPSTIPMVRIYDLGNLDVNWHQTVSITLYQYNSSVNAQNYVTGGILQIVSCGSITPSPTITPTPTNTFTITPTPTGTLTPTYSPTPTMTNTPTNTATNTATQTVTNTATETATNTATNTVTQTATNTATQTATNTATQTATNTATQTATYTVTPTETVTYFNVQSGSSTPVPLFTTGSALYYPINGLTLTNSSAVSALVQLKDGSIIAWQQTMGPNQWGIVFPYVIPQSATGNTWTLVNPTAAVSIEASGWTHGADTQKLDNR